jgi:hypothetical protein
MREAQNSKVTVTQESSRSPTAMAHLDSDPRETQAIAGTRTWRVSTAATGVPRRGSVERVCERLPMPGAASPALDRGSRGLRSWIQWKHRHGR